MNIVTNGAGAFGILAQSIGSGGGLIADSTTGTVYAGSTGTGNLGSGGEIDLTVHGSIVTNGANSVGIFAQSATKLCCSGGTGHQVIVNVKGSIQGGSGPQGAGIWIADGFSGSGQQNQINIEAGNTVSALSGTAITYSGNYDVDVLNNGAVIGSYYLGSGGVFTNAATLIAGPSLSGASLVNSGILVVGPGGGTTITGNYVQTTAGTIQPAIDFASRSVGGVTVQGDASLAGQVLPAISSVLPGVTLPFLTVQGNLTGSLAGGSSALFGYGVTRSGNQLSIAATSANFAPASFQLAPSLTAAAQGLQSIWNQGGTPALAPLFALLGNTADASPVAYGAQLRQLSPDATVAPGARGAANAQSFANATLSCPQFDGTTAMLVEGQCTWLRVTGRAANQSSGNGVSSYSLDTATTQIGGQKQIAPGWFLGGSLAYETAWLSGGGNQSSGTGQTGYGAITLKHQTGPWLFEGSLFGGAGQFDTSRTIALPGYASVAKGDPDISNVGLLARVIYTIGSETVYMRPTLSLSVIHVGTGGYHETGAGALDLSVDPASSTTASATPMVEFGGWAILPGGDVLRPYVAAGFSLLSNNTWQQSGRLTVAPAGSGGFSTTLPIDPVVGRIAAGIEFYTGRAIDLRLQYDGEFSGTVAANSGSLLASIRF